MEPLALLQLGAGLALVAIAWLLPRHIAGARKATMTVLLLDIAPLALGAGLRAYAEALRPRLMRYGVGVTVVCPGFFASPMTGRWQGPTPFLASGDKAARHIKRGIDRGRRRVHFPWPLVFGMRFCDIAPAWIGDAILRRFRFRIRPA